MIKKEIVHVGEDLIEPGVSIEMLVKQIQDPSETLHALLFSDHNH